MQVLGPLAGDEFASRCAPRKVVVDGVPRVAVLDVLRMLGYSNASSTWASYKEKEPRLLSHVAIIDIEAHLTPVITAQGFVLLINILTKPVAVRFREAAAGVIVRYLGGDNSLVQEIYGNRVAQQHLPEGRAAR